MAKKKPYRTTKWKGRENYQCTACPAATLSADRMRDHLHRRHDILNQGPGDSGGTPEPEDAGTEKS